MKRLRQAEILKILEEREVRSQREIVAELKKRGFQATQATVSRDLQDLNVARIPEEGPRTRYARLEGMAQARKGIELPTLLRNFMEGVDWSGNLVVIHTGPGNAQTLARGIDQAGLPDLLGTVAGDDTIICVVKEGRSTRKVTSYLKGLAEGRIAKGKKGRS